MKITVHRGANQIGGSCIEVASGKSRLIFDLGTPLMAPGGGELDNKALKNPSVSNGILPDVKGLYEWDEPSVDAVLLSHGHLDHYGLLDYVHPDIPIYLSGDCVTLIEVGNIFWPKHMTQEKLFTHHREFAYWKELVIGDFTIVPYMMDHSAFGACSFLITAEGKKVFYTGDLRGHGRKSKLFDTLIKDKKITNIDCLIMEGTTLGGKHNIGYHTEEDVETAMRKVFKDKKDVSFVMAAGSNIDRLVSIYKATLNTGKLLVVDLYQYYLLTRLKKHSPGLPPHPDDHLRVLYLKGHAEKLVAAVGVQTLYDFRPRKIGKDDIVDERERMVLRLSLYTMDQLAKKMNDVRSLANCGYIYSMWSGYLTRDASFKDFGEKYGIPLTTIHTSGHAYVSELKKLANAMSPTKLVPVHTLSGGDFEKHFNNVVRVKDGATLVV